MKDYACEPPKMCNSTTEVDYFVPTRQGHLSTTYYEKHFRADALLTDSLNEGQVSVEAGMTKSGLGCCVFFTWKKRGYLLHCFPKFLASIVQTVRQAGSASTRWNRLGIWAFLKNTFSYA